MQASVGSKFSGPESVLPLVATTRGRRATHGGGGEPGGGNADPASGPDPRPSSMCAAHAFWEKGAGEPMDLVCDDGMTQRTSRMDSAEGGDLACVGKTRPNSNQHMQEADV